MARTQAAVSWASTFFQGYVRVLDTLSVVRILGELVIHISGTEVELLNFPVFWAGFAKPNLSFAFEYGGGEDSVAFGADASCFSNLFSLGSFYLNSLHFNHRLR